MTNMDDPGKKPVAFVSSTCYDLKQIREDLKDFFEDNYGFKAMLSEFDSFPIDPCIGTFENCLNNVDKCADLFLLIIGNRYGYITDTGKSITNLEYLHAKAKGIPIFVFVSKQVYNNLPLWRLNKDADFSAVVDNSKIFEFVSNIYDENHQWVYTYENVRDIKVTLKNQLSIIFSEGLRFCKIQNSTFDSFLQTNLPSTAIRVLIEKPFAWEYKFLAFVIKDQFEQMKTRKWDLKYGIFEGQTFDLEPLEFLDYVSEKLHEIMKLTDILSVIVNDTIQEAIAKPGEPSDLELMVYSAKKIAFIYGKIINWALCFKTLHTDKLFNHLLELLYDLPKPALNTVEKFVDKLYNEITILPEIDDKIERRIDLKFCLDKSNTDEINYEMRKIASIISN